ncbi:helix-turn-helix domain-containing protein [Actinosynnema sp. CA-299493]
MILQSKQNSISLSVRPHERLRHAITHYRAYGPEFTHADEMVDRKGVTATLSFRFGSPNGSGPEGSCRHLVFKASLSEFVAEDADVDCGHCAGVDVFIHPWAAHTLLGSAGRDAALSARKIHLQDRGLQALLRTLSGAADWSTRFAVLDAALLRRWDSGTPTSPPVRRAWRAMTLTHGTSLIPQVATAAGWSHRQLSRRFSEELGVPPKMAARVLRLHRALRSLSAGLPGSRVAVECHFYDQAHLSRECRALTGMSPRQITAGWRSMAISSKTGDAVRRQDHLVGSSGRTPRKALGKQTEDIMENVTAVYEAPTLVEVGDFDELTQLTSRGYWIDSPWGAYWF